MAKLFDPNNTKGIEAKTLYELADRLSECAQFIELSEQSAAAEARKKITIGPVREPFDYETYTKDELENDFFFCVVAPADLEGHNTESPDAITECPLEGGLIEVYIRRQVRESELAIADGGSDVYLFFLDRIGAIQHQVHEAARTKNTPKLNGVGRAIGPSFATMAQEVAQGSYIWASLMVDWGDTES